MSPDPLNRDEIEDAYGHADRVAPIISLMLADPKKRVLGARALMHISLELPDHSARLFRPCVVHLVHMLCEGNDTEANAAHDALIGIVCAPELAEWIAETSLLLGNILRAASAASIAPERSSLCVRILSRLLFASAEIARISFAQGLVRVAEAIATDSRAPRPFEAFLMLAQACRWYAHEEALALVIRHTFTRGGLEALIEICARELGARAAVRTGVLLYLSAGLSKTAFCTHALTTLQLIAAHAFSELDPAAPIVRECLSKALELSETHGSMVCSLFGSVCRQSEPMLALARSLSVMPLMLDFAANYSDDAADVCALFACTRDADAEMFHDAVRELIGANEEERALQILRIAHRRDARLALRHIGDVLDMIDDINLGEEAHGVVYALARTSPHELVQSGCLDVLTDALYTPANVEDTLMTLLELSKHDGLLAPLRADGNAFSAALLACDVSEKWVPLFKALSPPSPTEIALSDHIKALDARVKQLELEHALLARGVETLMRGEHVRSPTGLTCAVDLLRTNSCFYDAAISRWNGARNGKLRSIGEARIEEMMLLQLHTFGLAPLPESPQDIVALVGLVGFMMGPGDSVLPALVQRCEKALLAFPAETAQ